MRPAWIIKYHMVLVAAKTHYLLVLNALPLVFLTEAVWWVKVYVVRNQLTQTQNTLIHKKWLQLQFRSDQRSSEVRTLEDFILIHTDAKIAETRKKKKEPYKLSNTSPLHILNRSPVVEGVTDWSGPLQVLFVILTINIINLYICMKYWDQHVENNNWVCIWQKE